MQSLWQEPTNAKDDLDIRVHSSRIIGMESDLVLHGGGNTSVKSTVKNLFGEDEEILYVKGSGWDLATIERAGFAPVRMDTLIKLSKLEHLTDTDMVNSQKSAMINPNAPTPSIEAILHAIIPFKFVDHTHADAVVAVTNTPNGEANIKEIYGDSVIIIPYVMPGFILAKEIQKHIEGKDLRGIDALILMNHGIFTFDDDAQKSYEKMITAVDKAEKFIAKASKQRKAVAASAPQAIEISAIRKKASEVYGSAMIAKFDGSEMSAIFAAEAEAKKLCGIGPLTPDHVIRTKQKGVYIENIEDIQKYSDDYKTYFERNNDGTLTMLDTAPRWGVYGGGTIAFGQNVSDASIISDIKEHTLKSILNAEDMGGYVALSEAEIFKMEYWELEQAKLKKSGQKPEFQGKVVVVTGGASGIGKACVESFAKAGAAVAALDISPSVESMYKSGSIIGIACDLTKKEQIESALSKIVSTFGGIDVLVNNAGIFPPSQTIENIDDETWGKSIEINLTAQQMITTMCVPYLKNGIDPAIVFVVSKNALAPGKGAACYSVAKAGANQLARIAALELAPDIRVNMLHPDAVFDTGIWNDEVIAKRAANYGMSVEDYKTRNLLKTEISSFDVANLAMAMAGKLFSKVTGSQIAVDGGSDRII